MSWYISSSTDLKSLTLPHNNSYYHVLSEERFFFSVLLCGFTHLLFIQRFSSDEVVSFAHGCPHSSEFLDLWTDLAVKREYFCQLDTYRRGAWHQGFVIWKIFSRITVGNKPLPGEGLFNWNSSCFHYHLSLSSVNVLLRGA